MPYKDKETERAARRAYRAAHREEERARGRRYYHKHRAKRLAHKRAYNEENREEVNAKNAAYRAAHRDEKRAYYLATRERDRPKERARKLFRMYGVSMEWWLEQAEQGCAICGSQDYLCVDHCHDTSVVRGLLCKHCNLALGHLQKAGVDVTQWGHKAAAYLGRAPVGREASE